jgi:hypothetical protein
METLTKKERAEIAALDPHKGFIKNKPFNGKLLARDMLDKRKANDLTTRSAAKAAKVDPGTFNNMEFGKGTNLSNLVKVCNWLQYPLQRYFNMTVWTFSKQRPGDFTK